MKIVSTVEARTASTRLPGKVLKTIVGKPVIELLIERLKRSNYLDEVVLATTINENDNILADLGKKVGIKVFRGSEEDVLGRILGAAKSVGGEVQVQICGDCPLLDPAIIDNLIKIFLNSDYDFVSNAIKHSYPVGLDCRVFKVLLLEEVDKKTNDSIHRVHGTTYIYETPGRYKILNVEAPPELNHPEWRWTLDTSEDFEFISKIYENLYYKKPDFDSYDILDLLRGNPALLEINKSVKQKGIHEG